MQSGPGKGGRGLYFPVSFAQGSFAAVHFVVCGFAGREGSWKGEEWAAATLRKGREKPYLSWPVGDRERHTQQLCVQWEGCACALSIVRDS